LARRERAKNLAKLTELVAKFPSSITTAINDLREALICPVKMHTKEYLPNEIPSALFSLFLRFIEETRKTVNI
jgi:hypothetical protein